MKCFKAKLEKSKIDLYVGAINIDKALNKAEEFAHRMKLGKVMVIFECNKKYLDLAI